MTGPIAPRLPTFYRLVVLDSIDSTNEEARRRATAGAPEGTLIWAGEQTAGRGRRGRVWQSPRGNLYLSLVLRPDCPPATAAQVGFVAAIGLGDALAETLGDAADIAFKWPNDVLVGRRKIAGILLEAATKPGGSLDSLVVGVGVNVASYPTDMAYAGTSLAASGAAGVTEAVVLERFCRHFLHWFERWRDAGFDPVRRRWLERALGVGEAVEVRLERETLSGRFIALDESGALALELPQGTRRTVTAGDVFYPGL